MCRTSILKSHKTVVKEIKEDLTEWWKNTFKELEAVF